MAPDNAISDGDRAVLRGSLIEERARIARQVAELDSMHTDLLEVLVQEVPDDEHDPDATTAFERAQVRSMVEVAKVRLNELDNALAAIDEPGFGRCAVCGATIGIERLRARPDAVRCISCSTPPTRAPLQRKRVR